MTAETTVNETVDVIESDVTHFARIIDRKSNERHCDRIEVEQFLCGYLIRFGMRDETKNITIDLSHKAATWLVEKLARQIQEAENSDD